MNRDELAAGLEANLSEMLDLFATDAKWLDISYAPGKWPVRDILTHVADTELAYVWRFCRASAEPGSAVEVFDQDAWVCELGGPRRSMAANSALFAGARGILIEHLRTMGEAQLLRTCHHPERGEVPAWRWAEISLGHARHHGGQVRAIREGRPWTPPKG